MSAKHLLSFMLNKLQTEGDTKVIQNRDGIKISLRQMFDDIGLKPKELSLNALDV